MASSVVTIQLGQCGNQVGAEFLDTLAAAGGEGLAERLPQFFRPGAAAQGAPACGVARAVMVDMEPKVVQHTVARARAGGRWCYNDHGQFTKAGGSGNNWAAGFGHHGPAAADTVVELVRREAERADCLGGLMLMHSLAGGTGSGVGAYFTQLLRDAYPEPFLLNHVRGCCAAPRPGSRSVGRGAQVVWPYESGEVMVQHYNSMLTLATISQAADGVVYFENEHVHQICGGAHQLAAGRETFDAMNQLIARQLAHCLLPAQRPAAPDGGGAGEEMLLFDVVRHCCANPRYRLLNTRMLPQMPAEWVAFERLRWSPLLRNLRQVNPFLGRFILNPHKIRGAAGE
jgi:tubulin delta